MRFRPLDLALMASPVCAVLAALAFWTALQLTIVGVVAAHAQGNEPVQERVTIQSEGWALVGNYTRPDITGRVPAVLLLHGAARDRRAYIPVAQELARRGVASLRLDLRGEGESTNRGRFEPGAATDLLENVHHDVSAALAWLARQPHIDPDRIGALGASFSGESVARAAREGAPAAAYVALSPGSFSDASTAAIDSSGRPWWFIASEDERFSNSVVRSIAAKSRTARVTMVDGTSHASDILSAHFLLNQEIADWFAATLNRRTVPALWGGLRPGAYAVGFRRHTIQVSGAPTLVDIWYPARPDGGAITFADYLRLSTDLRGATPGFPQAAGSLMPTLATAMSGASDAVPAGVLQRILDERMAATLDSTPEPGPFPLVMWTPRYGTTVAQSVFSEFVASLGFVVAFPHLESGGRLPFELPTPEAKAGELRARVEDMCGAIAYMERQPNVTAARIGVMAWSYTGEMASRLQQMEPRVTLVAGLSTNLLQDWVFQPAEAAATFQPAAGAAYAVLTQQGEKPGIRPAALDRVASVTSSSFPALRTAASTHSKDSSLRCWGLRRCSAGRRAVPRARAVTRPPR